MKGQNSKDTGPEGVGAKIRPCGRLAVSEKSEAELTHVAVYPLSFVFLISFDRAAQEAHPRHDGDVAVSRKNPGRGNVS